MKRTALCIRILMMLVILASLFVGSIHSQQSGTAISIDGAKIYYKTFGKGQPPDYQWRAGDE
ncbi:MAG: hypothetical protein IPN60_08010 [Saprospiraceae bacterium]|nr:hypothetical protein [Candidatus Opimibacter skivensis]